MGQIPRSIERISSFNKIPLLRSGLVKQ